MWFSKRNYPIKILAISWNNSNHKNVFRYNNKFCLPFILLIFIELSSCTSKSGEQGSSRPEETNILKRIKLRDMSGNPIDLSHYRGKTIFINFWATWCGPCIKEMPSIERAKNILKDKEIEFMVASNESVGQIQTFLKSQKLDLNYVQLENLEELNIQALPTTIIISPKGEVVFSETGYKEWDDPEYIELITKITNKNE